jgi:putative transposase
VVAAAIRTVFAQPDAEHVHAQLASSPACSAGSSRRSRPCWGRPKKTCWPSPPSSSATPKLIWSTNPLERLNKEIKRRTDVVGWGHLPLAGDFLNPEALLRLAGAVLVEAHNEWQVCDRRYLSEGSMAQLNRPEPAEEVAQPALIAS